MGATTNGTMLSSGVGESVIDAAVKTLSFEFSWADYTIFFAMLAFSVAIGIYFGCFGTRQSTASEYLMGGKKMKVLPIALSNVASHTSGIMILGVPADVYRYGSTYWLSVISFLIMLFPSVYIFLPVYFKLQITSTYEYLQRRFDNRTRVLSSFLFAFAQLLYLPIVIFLPALALSAATGINLHLITPTICGVCIFYTTIGGLKAVVWTDALQFTVTAGAMTALIVLGVKAVGGFGAVWEIASKGQRLNVFDFEIDINKRDDFWAVMIGYTLYWTSFSNANQGCVQKFLSVATLREVKIAALLTSIGLGIVGTASVLIGIVTYAKYSQCDPFATGQIKSNDQLVPYYVLDVAGKIPGFSGLFIAGVFSASLSTLSAHLNCLSGTIYEDFLSSSMSKDIKEKTKSNILKLIVVVAGIACTVMVFVVEHLGGVLPLCIAFNSVTNGPILGIFTLGVLFPRANRKGAFYGGISGLVLCFCVVMTSQYYKSIGLLNYPQKPISTDNCTYDFNSTINTLSLQETLIPEDQKPFVLFRISFYYYATVGFILTIAFGLAISYLTEKDDPVDKDLFSPIIHRWLKDEKYQRTEVYNYKFAEEAATLLSDKSKLGEVPKTNSGPHHC